MYDLRAVRHQMPNRSLQAVSTGGSISLIGAPGLHMVGILRLTVARIRRLKI